MLKQLDWFHGQGISTLTSHARRYLPFAAFAAAQLVVVLLAPSRPATSSGATLGGASPDLTGSGTATSSGQTATGGGGPAGTATGGGGLAGGGGAGTASGSGTGPGSASGGPGTQGGGAGSSGGQRGSQGGGNGTSQPQTGFGSGNFCISGLIEHTPCVRKWYGGPNGGATTQGVTGKSIKVLMYRPQSNAAVDAITKATGTYIAPDVEHAMLDVVSKWINSHYQLYGRTVDFTYIRGTCAIAPPDDSCFRTEADKIAAKYHPFALFWDTDSNEGAFMDELARKGIVTWGGWGFNDAFNQSLRPYHYDLFMSGDVQAQFAGEFWCSTLAGRKAQYAGPALKNKTRKVAVVYPNTPTTTPAAKHLEGIINHCDRNGAIDAPYSSNTSTAATQSTANTSKEKSEGVTSLIWMSDPIAPAYGTTAQQAQNFQPEEILAGGQLLDYDALAQTYNGSVWKHAFGLSDLANAVPVSQVDAGKIWRATGHQGDPNPSTNLLTEYALSLVGGIQAAGPDLTPLHYESGVLSTPGYDAWATYHDPRLTYVKFGPHDYTSQSDVRLVYWSTTARSPINGKRGAYIPLKGGTRYQLGQLPRSIKLPSSV